MGDYLHGKLCDRIVNNENTLKNAEPVAIMVIMVIMVVPVRETL